MFRGNLNRDGSLTTDNKSKLTLAWSYCIGGPVFSSPIVQNGIVYTASTSNNTLAALDIRTGKPRWHIQVSSPVYSSPSIQNGVLYVAAVDGTLYAIDAKTGSVRWQTQLGIPGAKFWSSPAVANGLVVIGIASALNGQPEISGELLAFDAATGQLRWRASTQGNDVRGAGIWSSPAIDVARGIVYVGTGDPDDGVLALNLHNGQRIWHWRSVTRDVSDTDVGAGPLLYHDQKGQLRVAVGGKDGFIYSLDASNGKVLWHTGVGDHVFSSPIFANGTLYAVGVFIRRSVSWALDAQTGAPRWQHAIPMIVYASPSIVGQTLYIDIGDSFGSGDGGVEVIDAQTGHLLQYADVHSTMTSSPAVLHSWLFVGANNGNLYAFIR